MRLRYSLLLCFTGCLAAERPPADAALRKRSGNAWIDCYRRFEPAGDPAGDLARLGELCAAPAHLFPVTEVHVGAAQGEADPPERLTFHAYRGRCYRAFAIAGPGVEALEVALYDEAGHLVAGDVSRDRWPVVPPRGPLCADRDGAYTIAIAVAQGSGEYRFQVWGSTPP